jgi:HEAT repeat protein
MKSLLLLLASSIALLGAAARGQDERPRLCCMAGSDLGTATPAPLWTTSKGKDFDYWRLRMKPPFNDSERKEAIGEVCLLIGVAWGRPGYKEWVTNAVVPPMAQLLQDESPKIRLAAAEAFAGHINVLGKESIPTLTQLLNDPDKNVRRAAARALGAMGPAAEVSVPAIAKAVHEDPSLAFTAAQSLPRIGSRGMDALLAMLDDSSDEIRSDVTSSIGVTGYLDAEQKRQVLPTLIRLLRDPSPPVRAAAVPAVAPTEESLPVIIELFHDKDVRVRATAVLYVPAVRQALPGVIELLKDDNSRVRGNAKIKLTRMAGAVGQLPPEITNLADDPDNSIRESLAENLGKGGPGAVPTLLKLLEDKDSVVGGAAAESLGEIGPHAKDAAVALQRHLTDRRRAIRREGGGKWLMCHAAAEALNQILGDKDYLEGLPPIPPDGK